MTVLVFDPPIRIGEPGWRSQAGDCEAEGYDRTPHPWLCTLNKGHAGWHVAGGEDELCAVWSDPPELLIEYVMAQMGANG